LPVIPAKAVIHFSSLWKRAEGKLDSRFRGNDCAFDRPGLANDTSTGSPFPLTASKPESKLKTSAQKQGVANPAQQVTDKTDHLRAGDGAENQVEIGKGRWA